MSNDPLYTMEELARITETPGRTIRYYIARNLLAGPAQSGRNAGYTEEHLHRLNEIRELKRQGLTLHEIARRDQDADLIIPEPSTLTQFVLSPEVTVLVAGGVAPWRMNLIKKHVAELAALLNQPVNQEANHVD